MSDDHERLNLWKGAFKFPNDRWRHEAHFFLAIQRRAPEVLRCLHDDVLPVLAKAVGDYSKLQSELTDDPQTVSYNPIHELLINAVSPAIWKWAERFHLLQPKGEAARPGNLTAKSCGQNFSLTSWSAEAVFTPSSLWSAAYGTLMQWVKTPPIGTALEWNLFAEDSSAEMLEWPEPLWFWSGGWAIFTETRVGAEQRILHDVKAQLKAYLDRKERKACRKGLEQRPRTIKLSHFEWLVRFQVQGWSHNKIGKSYGCTRPAVEHGIKQAARSVIGRNWKKWLRPPGKPGRQKGNS